LGDGVQVFAYGNGGHIWMPPGAVIPGPPGTMWQLVPVVGTPKSKEKSEKDKQEGGTEKKQTPAKQDKQEKQQPVINSQMHRLFSAAHFPCFLWKCLSTCNKMMALICLVRICACV